MDIYHHITFGKEAKVDEKLDEMGITYKKTLIFHRYILTFDIYESDPNWPTIQKLMQENGVKSQFTTVFSNDEVLKAEWLRLAPTFEQGYPQPENVWLKNRPNYENFCRQCGAFRQTDSFYLKKESHLRKNDFMSLYWARALFARHLVFETLADHRLQGFEKWDALIHKTKQPSTTVAQLYPTQITHPGLSRIGDLKSVTCSACGITKYMPHMRGVMYFERNALSEDVDVLETSEWFGDGHRAFRELLVSQQFAKLAIEEGWKGIRFKVVELV